jgi:hypothetical protein
LKSIVRTVWIFGAALALLHLRFLAGSDLRPGFWLFAIFLLACYSLPFFLLARIQLPENKSPSRYATLALVAFILALSLFLPTRRFFPGYRPEALEGLGYLFVSVAESGLVALFLIIRPAANRPTQKG